ncbi:LysR family transcriptional regulator [Burkholderia lata]|uniref:LysR family transcriptional regulator n=1 Tax=Burkholderia lata (strain ATCC 17760 / DSM 23089 / LMG 22485 / NCIMB 9086 / R18194 / 383) TaxID=482957 RepID=A0A6P2XDU0_BURL3|nr:LysR substrate-binding domain-containing protein [Burkholderia lata]VWD07434.1 LysR family transcriptional regulator [Burkholderia lata]
MERLEDLLFFAEVVEHAGFSAAARSLGLPRSKLSRRIAELEARMGVRLLQRNTRRVSLTPAGEAVYDHARAIAHEAREAFNVATKFTDEPRGLLRVASSPTIAANALMPVIAAFLARYPALRVLVNAADQSTDVIGERVDLAFRVASAPLDDSSLVMRTVSAMPMVLAASAALVAAHGPLTHPEQIAALGWIALASQDGPRSLRFVRPDDDDYMLRAVPRLMCANMQVLHSAVTAGLGVAALPRYLCTDLLASGKLVDAFAPDSPWRPDASFVVALMPNRQGITLTTRVFLEFATPMLEQILTRA